MDDRLALANEILPLFRANTLRGLTRTCGYYAFGSGRVTDDVGHALHLIGAACVLARVPVAPIRFVEHVEDEWRGIFAIAAADSIHAGAWPLMCAASRLHTYSESDFEQMAGVLRTQLKACAQAGPTPLGLWRIVVDHAFAQAAQRYEQIISLSRPPGLPYTAVPTRCAAPQTPLETSNIDCANTSA
jgi:hypothetical protein